MNRRQFHRTVAATAAALALDGKLSSVESAAPAALPPDPLPVGAAARLGCNRLWHVWPGDNPGLNDLTFSPDGHYLATLGHQDDHVFIWSVPDGRAVRDWEPQNVDRGGDLLWTAQGLYVSSSGGLSLWEPLTAAPLHRFTSDATRGVVMSADGRYLAAAAFVRGAVGIWDTHTRSPVASLNIPADGPSGMPFGFANILLAVAFSRCGRWLAAAGYSHLPTGRTAGVVHCWDITARRCLMRFPTGGGPVGRLAFTPTGRLLTADWAGTIGLWEPLEGRPVREWQRPSTGDVHCSLAVNAAGQIALQREDGVRLWHPDPSQEALLCPARGHTRLAYSPDGQFVAVGGRSGRVELYDAATGADLSPPDRHTAHVGKVEVSADGSVCLAQLGYFGPEQEYEIVLRDTRTGARLGAKPPASWQPLALAPVGTLVAGRLNESRLAVWDWASGNYVVHAELDPRAVAWLPDGQTLVAVADNSAVATWHPKSGQGRRQPVASRAPLMAVAVAAGRAAAVNKKGQLFLWQLDQDDAPRRFHVRPPPSRPYGCSPAFLLALAPDGLSVALSYGDGVVYAGSVTADELRPVYTHPPGHEDSEDGSTVFPRYTTSGRLLIVGLCTMLRDNHWWYTAVVTDGLSGETVWRSPPQPHWPTAMALSPDGRALLTGHEDGTLLVWPLEPGA